ncbi:hypothetical protein QYF36_012641 [Acer negundo]|nr:hypothetical protein QYF36_012641 [Acer negundo]
MKSTAMIVAVVLLAKFVAGLIPPLICKVPKRDAIALALIMSSKGIVELTAYTTLANKQVPISYCSSDSNRRASPRENLYNPSRKYAGYQKRNIMHSKGNSELRILACIYWPDNILSIINFLQASTPTRESPVAVYVLHLINLSGRAAPPFISHKMQMKTISNRSYSKNVILSFSCFEENSGGTVAVHPFTAVSPHKLMHEDVYTLELDKLMSLVEMNANISLTIVRFIAEKNVISMDWEKVLDSEVLKDIKPGSTINERLKYTMEMVNDGEETLSKIQSMAGKHDLNIVGREIT